MVSQSVAVGPQGRIVIPAPVRKALHLKTGDTLVARVEGGRLILETRANVLKQLRGKFAHLAPGRNLVDELLAERRAEAEQERQA